MNNNYNMNPNQNMNPNYNQNQNFNNGSVPMMSQGFAPQSNMPHQNIPTQDFLLNDCYKEGNFNAFFASDYIMALRNAKSAFIKQKVELLEVLTGCETKNRYSVYLRYDNGVNALLFKCKEESTWCSRNCLTYELIKANFFYSNID